MAEFPSDWKKDLAKFTIQENINVYTFTTAVNGNKVPMGAGQLKSKSAIITKYEKVGTFDTLKIQTGSKGTVITNIGTSTTSNIAGLYILSTQFSSDKDRDKAMKINGNLKEDNKSSNEATTDTPSINNKNDDSDADTDTSPGILASIFSEMQNIEDTFIEDTNLYDNEETYYNNLSNGLRVEDLRGILGMPHQFLPLTDPRIDDLEGIGDNEGFGRTYSEKIIKHIPLLLMTPGEPQFMSGYSSEQKAKLVSKLEGWTEETLESIMNGGKNGKYYSLKYSYTEYFYYVNAMLRSAAHFLEIHDEKVDGSRLGSTNWLYKTANTGDGVFSHGKLSSFLGPYKGCIAFYADAGNTVDDSFGNSTSDSQIAGTINGLSDQARELNFLLGTVGSNVGLDLEVWNNGQVQNTISDLSDKLKKITGGSNALSNLLTKGTTILAGGRLIFPEIWTDSSFSRSYNCSMKLVSPSGDKLSVYLNILVPIYHLLAFTLPRETKDATQAYFSPFLVRAFYKGLFNVDMGIIPGLSITKGEEGEWTLDGIPTVANVSFEIKDLYNGLYMSKQTLDTDNGIMKNIAELDYIANSCGINVNDQEIWRTIRMSAALGFTSLTDKVTIGIFAKVGQYFNQKMNNIFGKF